MIKFIHVPRSRCEILLPPEHLPHVPAILFTRAQNGLAAQGIFFQPGFALTYLPVCGELACFEREVVSLLGLACGFTCSDL